MAEEVLRSLTCIGGVFREVDVFGEVGPFFLFESVIKTWDLVYIYFGNKDI